MSNVAKRRPFFRPPRRAIPTVAGLFALAAPVFLGAAAITATNNLLFLLLGASLATIVVSGILSEKNLRGVDIEVKPVGAVYAGQVSRMLVRFVRKGHEDSYYDLYFYETSINRILPRKPKSTRALDVHLDILDVPERVVVGERIFDKRGKHEFNLGVLSTQYPFGLLTKSMDIWTNLEIWVRPKLIDVPLSLAHPPKRVSQGEGGAKRGLLGDLYGIRERHSWDPVHRIHALRSLALGKELVVEMSELNSPEAIVGVANTLEGSTVEAFEHMLELAQAAIMSWTNSGYDVGLVTYSEVFLPGEESLDSLLDHLSLVEPQAKPKQVAVKPAVWLVPKGCLPPPQSDECEIQWVEGSKLS